MISYAMINTKYQATCKFHGQFYKTEYITGSDDVTCTQYT